MTETPRGPASDAAPPAPAPAAAGAVPPLFVDWCVRHLASPPVEQFFGVQRLSAVHGLRLADGREVVLKVRGALDRQGACTVVHEAMWRAGVPCPRPLAAAHGDFEAQNCRRVPGVDGQPRLVIHD